MKIVHLKKILRLKKYKYSNDIFNKGKIIESICVI